MTDKLKNDKYKKSRGGPSRLLEIGCAKCGEILCHYQKDGPGVLKRMYFDRIYNIENNGDLINPSFKEPPQFICKKCHAVVGVPMVYVKEKRLAFRLILGSFVKKIVKTK